jgi:hypothetical protein
MEKINIKTTTHACQRIQERFYDRYIDHTEGKEPIEEWLLRMAKRAVSLGNKSIGKGVHKGHVCYYHDGIFFIISKEGRIVTVVNCSSKDGSKPKRQPKTFNSSHMGRRQLKTIQCLSI